MIQTARELKLENLLSLRKKMTMKQIQDEMFNLELYLKENNIEKNGPVVTTTFSVEQILNEQIVDMEILIPIKHSVKIDNTYLLKKEFHLTNAIFKKHIMK
ncbi:MAG: hypothetical protein JXR64_06150 [Spirochaetales bacterium]|nr:hypothetical protein [Spirochaetales bacterium]